MYTSGTLALALLEVLVHADWDTAPELVAIPADLPDDVARTAVDVGELPAAWQSYPAATDLQLIGARWLDAGETAILVVPSVVIPIESHYVINPVHADFRRIRIGTPAPFVLDSRLARR